MPKNNGLKKTIDDYLKAISQKIPIHRALLFGSYASGKAGKFSDIDLAIISPAFKPKTHLKDLKLLWTEAAKVNSKIEPLPFSSAELKNVDPRSFLAAILKSGKVVYRAN